MTRGSVTSGSTRPRGSLMEAPGTRPQPEAQQKPSRSRSAWPSKGTHPTKGDAKAAGKRIYVRGGRRLVNHQGYIRIFRLGHPMAGADGFVLEHRMVAYDAGLDPTGLHVHHINEDKTDNRIENLRLLTNSEHQAEHNADGGHHYAKRAHCKNNHPYPVDGPRRSDSGRRCLMCEAERAERRRVQRQAAPLGECRPPYHRLDCTGCAS